jgi:hypothetical protein
MLHVVRIILILVLCISLDAYVLYAVIRGIRTGRFRASAHDFVRKKSPVAFWCSIAFNLLFVVVMGWVAATVCLQ